MQLLGSAVRGGTRKSRKTCAALRFWSQKRRNSCNVSTVQPQKSPSPPPLLPSTTSSRSMDISTWVWTSLCFSPLSPWRLESGQTCWRREKLLCFLTLKKGLILASHCLPDVLQSTDQKQQFTLFSDPAASSASMPLSAVPSLDTRVCLRPPAASGFPGHFSISAEAEATFPNIRHNRKPIISC